jgi:hypothetical protein
MIDVLTNPARREWLAEAGIARTAEFRWSSSAQELHRAYVRAGAGLR